MKVIPFLKLIRWKNLVMLGLIQLLFKYVYFETFNVDTALNTLDFLILMTATGTIAAAGYILNDIYDIHVDKINKPKKVLVTKKISIARAHQAYNLLNGIGLLAGFYVAYRVEKLSFVAIFVITIMLLKVYNSGVKKLPLIGNLLISVMVSVSILIVGVFDLIPEVNEENIIKQYLAFRVLIDYAVFAFMFMLLREIVKDIEDVNGDRFERMKTLPIILGRRRTKNLVFILSFIPLTVITFYSFENFNQLPFILAYMLLAVALPLMYFMTKILYAKYKKDYIFASKLLKWIMLLGMLSIILISISIHYAE
ncbi:geranylgeranylglycerol-phosphate geranylgeranyltransferase [Flavobacteriaceae bacterium F08102]|nr:geranylgeranylglycerol-phosphate geranylgeranyltransferase [Flavobacteriaceae bacterium F08102]